MFANILSSLRSSSSSASARTSIKPAIIRARPSDMTDSSQDTSEDDQGEQRMKIVIPAYRVLPYHALQLDPDRELFIIDALCRDLRSRIVDEPETYTSFCGRSLPTISMEAYMARLVRYVNDRVGDKPAPTSTGISIALVAVEYLSGLQITPRTQHRLFMTAFLVVMKMYAWDDGKEVSNRQFAHSAGCDLRDINWMELFFCTRVRNFTFPLPCNVEQRLAAYTTS